MKSPKYLNNLQVKEMIRRHQSGETIMSLAKEFGVHYNTANQYCNPDRRRKEYECKIRLRRAKKDEASAY